LCLILEKQRWRWPETLLSVSTSSSTSPYIVGLTLAVNLDTTLNRKTAVNLDTTLNRKTTVNLEITLNLATSTNSSLTHVRKTYSLPAASAGTEEELEVP